MTKMRSSRLPEDTLARLIAIPNREHERNQTQALITAIDHYYQSLHPPDCKIYPDGSQARISAGGAISGLQPSGKRWILERGLFGWQRERCAL